jgi:adenine-specific DNA-methyltransferase
MQEVKTINAERRAALRKDENYIHVMKYMGSKRELLPDIKFEIDKVLSEGDGVLDLFAGTGSVGLYLKEKFNIYSNDIQSYSSVITDALISSSNYKLSFEVDEKLAEIESFFLKNKNKLSKDFGATLETSKSFVAVEKRAWTEKLRRQYIKFVDSFPSPVNEFATSNEEGKKLLKAYKDRTTQNTKFPYVQTAFLFSETYFSFEQAIDIDSIRYAIDQCFQNSCEKSIALTALIYAYSYTSSGTGHFAMFRDLKTLKSINDVFLYRDRSVWDYFEKKFREIIEFHSYNPGKKHRSFSLDYKELLNNEEISKNYKLIYADPPYSFVHYSRFYHATESLVRYDYMMPEHKGRYRTDRHQSPFCQKQNVTEAFTILISAASKGNKYLLLSYADTGMISLEELCKIFTDHGMSFKIRSLNYDHSTMGREGHKSNQIKELLILAEPLLYN